MVVLVFVAVQRLVDTWGSDSPARAVPSDAPTSEMVPALTITPSRRQSVSGVSMTSAADGSWLDDDGEGWNAGTIGCFAITVFGVTY